MGRNIKPPSNFPCLGQRFINFFSWRPKKEIWCFPITKSYKKYIIKCLNMYIWKHKSKMFMKCMLLFFVIQVHHSNNLNCWVKCLVSHHIINNFYTCLYVNKQKQHLSWTNQSSKERTLFFSVFIRKINQHTSIVTYTLPVGEPVKQSL